MPLTEGPADAVANTYAKALFELAQTAGGRDQAENVLGQLEDILELARQNARFGEFLSSRLIPTERRAPALEAILKGRVDDLTYRFLQILNAKGRLGHLGPITTAFDGLVQHAFGRIEVDVTTAQPISPEMLEEIRARLADQLGKDPILHPYTDPAILGGVRLRIGDQLVDATLASRLRQLKNKLDSDGMSRVRAKAASLIEGAGDA
ncbi:MAG: ATP synthase F1 subunit delta [Phycisphaerales bacterium]|nr:MAG: ATP synthase F1 subunit delta [Phycisphaerales bacterium]